jgi:ATP-dependent Clp protease ATP-binding subunit ClpC
VERYLEDPLAEALLRGDIKAGDIVKVSRKEETEEVIFTPVETKAPDEAGV